MVKFVNRPREGQRIIKDYESIGKWKEYFLKQREMATSIGSGLSLNQRIKLLREVEKREHRADRPYLVED